MSVVGAAGAQRALRRTITLVPLAGTQRAQTGMGIPADEQKYLFDRFSAPEQPDSKRSKEQGLGLSILHDLAQAHGGRIDSTSHENIGTTFASSDHRAPVQKARAKNVPTIAAA